MEHGTQTRSITEIDAAVFFIFYTWSQYVFYYGGEHVILLPQPLKCYNFIL